MLRIRRKDEFVDVPCGRCNFCLQNRRKEWSFRLQKELRQHESAFFLTLTYEDKKVPLHLFEDETVAPSLRKKDFQDFMKRLRKAHKNYGKLKYYAVGEYGTRTARPHYHAIIFGLSPKIKKILDDVWPHGFVHCGSVTTDSIDYVTKYIVNKYEHSHYPQPPFSCISNGIGLGHFEQNRKRYQRADTVINGRGYKQVLPKYYKDKLERNKFTNEISKRKNANIFEERQKTERERVAKLHPDPDAYIYQRTVASHDKISKHAKKGSKI